MKILHTTDIHLDSPLRSLALRDPELRDRVRTASRAALTRIVDIALAEDVTALLIAGDLFDGAERSARTAAFLTLQLERLRERGIRVFYIKGIYLTHHRHVIEIANDVCEVPPVIHNL